ncbi:MAG: ATP synthase F0 subunit A [Streptococcus pyogenes]|nr:MAG: ATP synthase F0 subunit A [Streptococcus pyogenes]
MITGGSSLNSLFAHLVPLGCPNALMPFIVVIERIRLIIRPLTLSVRLTANMIAGHIIMALISMRSINSGLVLTSSIASEVLITILELGVALIQPYVFFILLFLYRQEVQK